MSTIATTALPVGTSFTSTDEFVMNIGGATERCASSHLAASAGLPTLAAANTFASVNRFPAGGFNSMSVELGSAIFGFSQYSSHFILAQTGNNNVAVAFGGSGTGNPVGVILPVSNIYGWSPNSDPATAVDTLTARTAAGVMQIAAGAVGTGGGLHLPETASDTDPAAPSTGVILYSKKSGGKNALFARFPTGAVQQISIEP